MHPIGNPHADLLAGGSWAARGGEALRLRVWDDSGVVFDPVGGETHLLGRLACDILRWLQCRAMSATQLADLVAQTHGIEKDAELTAAIETTLQSLLGLDLVVQGDE